MVETIGANAGFLKRQVDEDLKRFKEFIASRQAPTGAWRGEIRGDRVQDDTPTRR